MLPCQIYASETIMQITRFSICYIEYIYCNIENITKKKVFYSNS